MVIPELLSEERSLPDGRVSSLYPASRRAGPPTLSVSLVRDHCTILPTRVKEIQLLLLYSLPP